MEHFTIVQQIYVPVRRFRLNGRKIVFKLNPIPEGVEPIIWIRDAVKKVVLFSLIGADSEDKVGFTFTGNSFRERGSAWVNYRNVSEVHPDQLWEAIGKVFQSNSEGM